MYMAPGRLLSPIASGGGPAGLDLNFLGYTADTLPSTITFSRAGMAWQYDSTGTLVTVPHNLLTNSQDFDASGWTRTQSTISGNVVANPLDGATNADKLLDNASTNVHDVGQAFSFVAGNQYVFSFYAKADTRDRLRVFLTSAAFGVTVTIRFNLAAGTVTANTAGTNGSSSITAVGSGGWYRCMVSAQATTSASANCLIRLENAAGSDSYLGDLSGVYLFGAQLAQSAPLRPYLNTSVRNLLGYSEDLSNAAWTKNLVTISANAGAAPDTTTTADKVIPNNAAVTFAECRQDASIITGATYTFSSYVKASGYNFVQISGTSAVFGTFVVTFDLSTGAETAFAAGTSAVVGRGISSVGNGWHRIHATVTALSSASGRMTVVVTQGGTDARGFSWTPNGTDGVLMWGAQLSSSGSLDAYSPNAAAAPTSAAYYGPALDYAYNGASWVAQGLRIEEARTNLFAGDLTVTGTWPAVGSVTRAAGATAPDASANGVTITEPAGGTTSYGFNSASTTITASTPATASIFAKAGTCAFLRLIISDGIAPTIAAQAYFNLSTGAVGTTGTFATSGGTPTGISATITAVGGGWYRCTITATLATATTGFLLCRMTSADNTSTDTGSKTMSFFGPQLEVGAFATSPILTTTTASVVRASDVATVPILGSWFSASSGTLMADYSLFGLKASGVQVAVLIDDGTASNRIGSFATDATGQNGVIITAGGVAQYSGNLGAPAANTRYVTALAWRTDDAAFYRDGSEKSTDASVTVPTVNQMRIGHRAGDALNGHIRRIRVYDRRLPNAVLQVLTS